MFAIGHIDKVDNDQTADIANAELPSHLFSGFQIDCQRRIIDMFTFGSAGGVHIDGSQCLGWIEYN